MLLMVLFSLRTLSLLLLLLLLVGALVVVTRIVVGRVVKDMNGAVLMLQAIEQAGQAEMRKGERTRK